MRLDPPFAIDGETDEGPGSARRGRFIPARFDQRQHPLDIVGEVEVRWNPGNLLAVVAAHRETGSSTGWSGDRSRSRGRLLLGDRHGVLAR